MAASPPAVDDASSEEEDGEVVKTQLKNSRWSLVSRLTIAGGALLSILILQDALKVEDFGRFGGVVALVAILGGLARLGASELMLERIARDEDGASAAYGRAMGTTMLATMAGIGLMVLFRPLLLPGQPIVFVIALAAGELLHVAGMDTAIRVFNSQKFFRRAGLHAIISISIRLASVASLLIWPATNLEDVGIRYAAAGLAVWFLSVVNVSSKIGRPKLSIPTTREELTRGATIAVGQTSLTVSTRIDQTLLVRQGLDTDAGLYGFGARIVFNSMLPAQALLEVVYPDFFRAGAEGGGSAHQLARRILKPLLIYGVFAALVLVGIAPVVEAILDDSFEDVMWVIIAMAGFPAIRISQNLAGDILSGLGAHSTRSRATIFASVLNVGMNLALIPSLGWRGAAISTYAADAFLLAAFWYSASRRRND